jgi:hypothetical protein
MANTRSSKTRPAAAGQLNTLQRQFQILKRVVAQQSALIERSRHEHAVTFERMSQIQGEVDALRRAWSRQVKAR